MNTIKCEDFLRIITEKADKFIMRHRDYNIPLSFGVGCGQISLETYDGGEISYEYRPIDLYWDMQKIATYVNNELGCGCYFYME